jgi:DNA-binding Lrp family transcriptional regulator
MSYITKDGAGASWTFLSNYSHVLICLATDPQMRMRDVALQVGITERAVQRIIADLEASAVIKRTRAGRQNSYEIDLGAPLRHPLESHRNVGDLLAAILPGNSSEHTES